MSREEGFDRTTAERLDDLAARTGARRERPTSYWAGRLAALRETVEASRSEDLADKDPHGAAHTAQLLARLQENVDSVNAGGQSRGYADLFEPPAHPHI